MMPAVFHPAYEVDFGTHVFPTRKYRLVLDRLLAEGTLAASDVVEPRPASDEDLALAHTSGYLQRLSEGRLSPQEERRLEVPYSPSLHEAARLAAGGSTLAGRLALERGVAAHVGGGFHHAFADHGEGFCLLNDVAVAARVLQRDGLVKRVAVVDLDVHQGNGTAAIFRGDPSVFTFSMHQEGNYPATKPPSDLDVGLADGLSDESYLATLDDHLPDVLARSRPDLVFYLAGADPYEHDDLGGLELSIEGLWRRDEVVMKMLAAARVPVAVCLAGGYAMRNNETVEIHCNTVRVCSKYAHS